MQMMPAAGAASNDKKCSIILYFNIILNNIII